MIPPPAWRHRRLYLALTLGLPPLHRSVFEAYVSTFATIVARAAKPQPAAASAAAVVPQVNAESNQLEHRTSQNPILRFLFASN